ncbi:hypothetical protein [Variovorax boronicumulans]
MAFAMDDTRTDQHMGNRSWLYLEHSLPDTEEASADEIAEANNNFPVLWQLLLADGAAGDAIDHQRVFGDAGTDNLASDAHAALARIRQLHAFVERHPMLHTLPQIALQFEAVVLHLAELIDDTPEGSAPRFSANLDELSWLGGDADGEGFIERNRRECNERWAEVQRCIDGGNHPGVDAALGVQRFADWEAWAGSSASAACRIRTSTATRHRATSALPTSSPKKTKTTANAPTTTTTWARTSGASRSTAAGA